MSLNPFDRFSAPAQHILTMAYQVVMTARHSQLDVEHILMAMLQANDPTLNEVVQKLAVDRSILQQKVQARLDTFPVAPPSPTSTGRATTISMYITPRLQHIFTLAQAQQQRLHSDTLEPDHLLLAMVEQEADPTAQLLKSFGLDSETLDPILDKPVIDQPTENVSPLTHFNETGRARMVDVSDKAVTDRRAVARGEIKMQPATLELIREGRAKKGDVLAVAQVAGIMAAKRTHELVPMCHPLLLTGIDLRFEYDEPRSAVLIEAEVKTSGQTGVEMEALTAVSVAALTIYDMVKATDKTMQIGAIELAHKSGGKSGEWNLA